MTVEEAIKWLVSGIWEQDIETTEALAVIIEALREKQERESSRAQPENEPLTRCKNCQNWDKSKSWSLRPGAHACTFWSPSQYEPRYTGGFEVCSFAKTKPERSDSDA